MELGTRTAYRGATDSIKVSAPNLGGKCSVVVDAEVDQPARRYTGSYVAHR